PSDNLKLIIIIAVIAGVLVLVFILVLIWLKRRRQETEAHSRCTTFQTQDDETIVYASLDLHALNEASAHRQHRQAEESTVYADIKHHWRS
ncbi:hypothetical protein chiPu_0021818, partial [Chiloscyllium punctatum]|nr:hypothetical protein [Chiloscyllium punctatum]